MERISNVDLEQSSHKNIWRLSWPVMIGQTLLTMLQIVDMFWIGKLGPSPVAGVAIAGSIMAVIFAFTQIFYAGNLASIARFAAREDRENIIDSMLHSALVALLLSLVIAAITIATTPFLFRLFGASETVQMLGIQYLTIVLVALPFFFAAFVIFSTLNAIGDTKTPTKIIAIATVFNAVLDPLLIFGIWRFPKLGIGGAALATSLSHLLVLALGVFVLARKRLLSFRSFTFRWTTIRRIFSIGIPAWLRALTRPLTGTVMFRIVALYGTSAIAAFGIGIRLLGLMFIYLEGLTTATQTLVGQSLGAKRPAKAEEFVRKVLLIGLAVQLPVILLYVLLAPQLISLFNDDGAVVRIGTDYLRIIVPSLILIVLTIGFGAAHMGAGDTKPPMIASIVANWFVKIPLAYLIAHTLHFASRGVWIAIACSVLVEALVVSFFYFRGAWKKFSI
jgi:putative MATE family efflux protein